MITQCPFTRTRLRGFTVQTVSCRAMQMRKLFAEDEEQCVRTLSSELPWNFVPRIKPRGERALRCFHLKRIEEDGMWYSDSEKREGRNCRKRVKRFSVNDSGFYYVRKAMKRFEEMNGNNKEHRFAFHKGDNGKTGMKILQKLRQIKMNNM